MDDLNWAAAERPTFGMRAGAALLTGACFIVFYNGTNYLTSQRTDLGIAVFAWERHIPFVPWMIIPYWSLDAFYAAAPFVCRTKAELAALVQRLMFGIITACTFFLLFPLQLMFVRPPVPGILGALFASLDQCYNFYNLAPSLHICLRGILWTIFIPKTRGAANVLCRTWFFLIGASTLLCWQHHVIDVFTGHLLALFTLHSIPERDKKAGYPAAVNTRRHINANIGIGCRYLLGALLLLGFAANRSPLSLFLLWPALSLGIVAAAYFGIGPRALGKRGAAFPAWSRILLFPYQAAAMLSVRMHTRGKTFPAEILPGLQLGKIPNSREAAALVQQGVTAVLDLAAEFPEEPALLELNYRSIPVLDLTAPSQNQLLEAAEFIRAASNKGIIYVHCALGRSRSAVAVAAYLLLDRQASSVASALDFIRARYSGLVIKDEYVKVLQEFLNSLAH